jgi:transcriptional antiterminator RfaH
VTYWCVAQTKPLCELTAQRFLALNGYETYLPRLRGVRRNHGRKVETRLPLFPSYLFIWIVSEWYRARSTPHVARLVLHGSAPARISPEIISEIRAREVGGLVELPTKLLEPGDRVRVLSGPFRDQLGVLGALRPHERVVVLLQLFGSAQRVELARDAIERE